MRLTLCTVFEAGPPLSPRAKQQHKGGKAFEFEDVAYKPGCPVSPPPTTI